VSSIRREADIIFPRQRVAVFLDGCFWHGCPDHGVRPRTNADYWSAKLDRNRARDAETDADLEAIGWLVMRVWEHEPPHDAAQRVAIAVRDRTG
jgi:DNA mismatch endonuclease (patch repair protein)